MASQIDLLIVGAGPTGLTLANDAARRGMRFRIIDKAEAATTTSKAIVVHARNLEMLENMSLVEPFLANGIIIHGSNVYSQHKRLVHLNMDEIDSHFNFVLAIPQSKTEELLASNLENKGYKIERGVELLSLSKGSRSLAVVQKGSDKEEISARYVVGCDGAHSVVRKSLGLTFDGVSYEEVFGAADVAVLSGKNLPMVEDEVYVHFSESGLMVFFPFGGGRYRLIFDTVTTSSLDLTFAEVEKMVRDRVGGEEIVSISDPHWMSWFKINRRCVTSYREENVFLAGDAAHIHSPVGGVGMNTGMQDAINLGWKLDLVLRGLAHDRLLDSYHTERHAVGKAVLQGTDLATKAVTLRNPIAKNLRNQLMSFLASQEVVQQRILKTGSLLGISYRHGPLTGESHSSSDQGSGEKPGFKTWLEFARGPQAGDKVIDGVVQLADGSQSRLALQMTGTKFQLLLFDGSVASASGYQQFFDVDLKVSEQYGDLIDVHIIAPDSAARLAEKLPFKSLLLDPGADLHRIYGAGSECLYLIRPDGYIAFRCQPALFPKLDSYLKSIL